MNKENAHAIKSKKMRAGAEKNLSESGISVKTDQQVLLHELQVQRLELEMQNVELRQQNEELQKTRAAAEIIQQNYTRLYDFSPSGYFTLQRDGAICELNFRGASLLGMERSVLIGRNFKLFIAKETLSDFNIFFKRIFESDGKTSCEAVLAVRDKPPVYAYIEGIASDCGQKCLLVVIDVSEHKEIENKLKLAGEYNIATLNALPDLLFEIDGEGLIHNYHAQNSEIQYIEPARFLGKKVPEIMPEEASRIIMDALLKASKCGRCSGVEYCLDIPGGVKWYELSISARGDHNEPDCLFIVLVRDITERKQQAEGISRLEKRFRHVIENMPAGAILCENDKIFINSHIEELSGYSQNEFNSPEEFFDTLFKEGFETIMNVFESNFVNKRLGFVSLLLHRKNGGIRNVDISRMLIEGQLTVWIFYDATDYLFVQKKLMKSELHLMEAHRVAHIGSYECDLVSGEISWSELCYEIMGIKHQKITPELIKSLIHPDDQEYYYSHYFDLFSKNKNFNIEYRIKRPDGKIIYICDEAIIKFDDNGIPSNCIGYYKDITLQKKAAEELLRSEHNKLQLLELSHEGYWAINETEKTIFVNNRVCEILGYSKDEIIEKKPLEFFASEHADLFVSVIDQCLIGEKTSYNSQMIHKNGHNVFVNMTVSPTFDDNGIYNGAFMLINDFTKQKELEIEIKSVRQELTEKYSYNDIIGKSPAMQVIFESLQTIAEADCNVLIEGPSGTGKNLIAKIIYNISNRKNKAFVVVNCGTLPENLLESELFGYVKGAFTGADKDKQGKFAAAEGGVVFLDEIGEMPLNLQVKILRIIEEKKFEPVGSNKTMTSDVRIVAATNKDLKKLVAEGKFRADLYFRLKIVSINIPPLKDRQEDIEVLTEYYINHFNEKYNKNVSYVSQDVSRFFKLYDFPGNVRELKNIMERAYIFCNDAILQMKHMACEYISTAERLCGENPEKNEAFRNIEPDKKINAKPDKIYIDTNEKKFIEETILKCGGNKSMAARELKIDYTTLWRKLKKYGMNELPDQNKPEENSVSSVKKDSAVISPSAGEKEILKEALVKAGNNKTEAGKRLKMSRTTLWRKLKKYELL